MTPWQKTEKILEEKLEQVNEAFTINDNPEFEKLGSKLATFISLCQDIDDIPTRETQEQVWTQIKIDSAKLIQQVNNFLEKHLTA